MEQDVLYHHGIKGQRWGVRRYQNPDGSLTAAGKRKQEREANWHDDYKDAHAKKSVKEMSTKELQARNTRMQAEKQYAQLTHKKSVGRKLVDGFIAGGVLVGGVTTAAIAYKTAYKKVLPVAKPIVEKGLDKIGDWVVKDLVISNLH